MYRCGELQQCSKNVQKSSVSESFCSIVKICDAEFRAWDEFWVIGPTRVWLEGLEKVSIFHSTTLTSSYATLLDSISLSFSSTKSRVALIVSTSLSDPLIQRMNWSSISPATENFGVNLS